MEDEQKESQSEQQTPKEPTPEEMVIQLYNKLQENEFFSNQMKVNSTLFNGFKLILDKLVKIEEKLTKMEVKPDEKTN
jgi:hypothetical protein